MALAPRIPLGLFVLLPAFAGLTVACGGGDASTEPGALPSLDSSAGGSSGSTQGDASSGAEPDALPGSFDAGDPTDDATLTPAETGAGSPDAPDALLDYGDAGPGPMDATSGTDAPAQDSSVMDAVPSDAVPDMVAQEAALEAAVFEAAAESSVEAGPEAQPEAALPPEAGPEAPLDASEPDVSAEAEAGLSCSPPCPSGWLCQSGTCVQPCTTDNDCWNDKTCDLQTKLCGPWPVPAFDLLCEYLAPPGVFAPVPRCEFSVPPPGDPFPNHRDVQATPIVVNFNKTSVGSPSIIAPFTATVVQNYTEGLGVIRVLRGSDCSLEANLGGVDLDNDGLIDWIDSAATVAAADLDGDGAPEVAAFAGDGSMLAFTRKNGQWSLLWKGRTLPNGPVFVDPMFNWTAARSQNWSGPSIHDLDDDGKPEVIREGYVFSSAGVLRSALPPGYAKYSQGLVPVLANLDQDPGIELTNGQYIWEWKAGMWHQEPSFTGAGAGFVAVADFGPYGAGIPSHNPEIVVVRSGTLVIYAIDGSFALSPRTIPGLGGGNPTIADYDGDGLPEVGVAGADFYSVFDIDCTSSPRPGGTCDAGSKCDNALGVPGACPAGILWSRKTQDHSSNITGSSVFDFEGDGRSEVVYSDECFTRVYQGNTGEVLFSQYRSSCTWYENPVIADVDGNFRADLVVPSNLGCSDGLNGIACGDLDANGVDRMFAGLHCKDPGDCVSGSCVEGLCRCTSTSQCCTAGNDAQCLELGYKCVPPPAGTPGTGNTCRAAHPHGVQGIRVYSDAQDKWVRSRWIWNQHAYAVTHVDSNGTVPKTSLWKNNWDEPGLNNFRQNVPGTASATATSDETVDGSPGFSCAGGSATLMASVCNRGANDLGAGLLVAFRDGTTMVCSAKTTLWLSPGSCELVSCVWPSPPDTISGAVNVEVMADADGAVTECKEGNNKGLVLGVWCP